LGALAVGAENALGSMIFMMIAEDSLAVGEQGRGDRFALFRGEHFALPKKIDGINGGRAQDGVLIYAVRSQWSLPMKIR
jgi:hypothetical protein